jgi:hypothetical protein
MKGRLKNNSLPDDEVDWGVMRIGHGRAFDLGETRNSHSRVTVRRQYMTANGRNILVEGVSMQSIRANLANLPRQTSASAKLPAVAFKTLALPKTPLAKVKQRPMRLASASPSNTGFLLDYVELNTDQDDYTFASGQTYYISGNVYISGTATIQGGAVIKYDTNSASSINILGTVECQTTPYWPAILTSSSDDTAGEPISAGNGSSCSCYGTLGITVFNCLDSGEDLTVYISDDNGTYLVNGETVSGGIRNYQDFSFMAGLGQRFLVDSFDTDGNEYYYDLNAAEDFSDLTLEGGPQRWDYYYQEDTQTPLCSAPPYPSLGLCLANGGSLNDLQFRNLDCGVESYGNCSVANLQFVQCGTAFDMENATLYAGNILMSHVGTGFAGQGFQVASGQLTFDQGSHVAVDSGAGGSWVTLSNALVTSVGDYGNVAVYTNSVATQADDTAIYQTGPLGNYYLPPDSPFIDAGTPTADKLGLYWWTTQTNQAIDGVTPVDLGYHYPAVDSNGNPVSTEVPGVPDYISDPNGNGLPDAWEIQYFGNLNHSASELDGVGNTLLFDYQHSANPNVSRYDAAGGMTFTNGLKMFIFEPKPASQIP